jgi:hypothetical protein
MNRRLRGAAGPTINGNNLDRFPLLLQCTRP